MSSKISPCRPPPIWVNLGNEDDDEETKAGHSSGEKDEGVSMIVPSGRVHFRIASGDGSS